jgi:M6 family metalloprotease-like protein
MPADHPAKTLHLQRSPANQTARRRGSLVVPLVLLFLASSVGAALGQAPVPDFAHPSTPHSFLFSRAGGQEDRPILVIYLRWDDVDFPAGVDAPMVASRFFGTGLPSTTFRSVGDYFRRASFNDLYLVPAAEWEGTEHDGIVQVTVPGTRADFFTLSEGARNKRALELANPYVDFASFDGDNNGSLSNLELIVNVLESTTIPLPEGCGIARGVQAVSLDGTNLSGLYVAMNNTATNLITIIHENAHAAADVQDLYGFDVGNFDLGAATCGALDATLFAPNAWHKMHWGWISPTVVTRDGFHDIRRADTTGDAFILYDPAHGTDDYFMVENRRPTPGTYDRSVADDGLIIWRVADAAVGVPTLTPIGLVRPTATAAAWDASDPAAPQRTMEGQAWFDGTSSNVAVRAISKRGDVMRAYFDVRGPGVLIDTYMLDLTAPVKVTAAGANQIDVPLMNTGEVCDTFVVEAVQLPPGWTTSPGARILCAGESSFARITLTPDANAAVGAHAIVVRGRSTTDAAVMTDSPLAVEVVLRSTRFGVTDLLSVTTAGTTTTFSACR